MKCISNQNVTPVQYRGIDAATGKHIYREASAGQWAPGSQFGGGTAGKPALALAGSPRRARQLLIPTQRGKRTATRKRVAVCFWEETVQTRFRPFFSSPRARRRHPHPRRRQCNAVAAAAAPATRHAIPAHALVNAVLWTQASARTRRRDARHLRERASRARCRTRRFIVGRRSRGDRERSVATAGDRARPR